MQGTELVEGVILCFAVKFFCISINNLYLFFEPRPSSAGCLAAKTGRGEPSPSKWTEERGEGGLLWLRK